MGVLATVKSPTIVNLVESTASENLELNMSSKDRPTDEREEGEIIDEYEDIISSDEEFSMRQRIEELVAKNAELEKIANISGVYLSGSYGNDYTNKDSASHHQNDRYPLISIDISDDEDYPPAPPMTRIVKRRKSPQHSCSRRRMIHSSSHRRRKKSSSPPPAPMYRTSDKLLLSMFHERVTAHSSHTSKRKRKSKKSHSTKSSRKSREYYATDSDDGDYTLDSYNVDGDDSYENFNSSDGDRSFSLNREKLRVALARNTHQNEQHVSLKERLIRRKENTDTLNEKTKQEPKQILVEEENKPNSSEEKVETEDNLEEQELRIIALRSAVIRKHLVRKKRNENIAYSPSDFDKIYDNMTVSPSLNNIDHAEACNSMEISPVPSPKMILSEDEGMDTKPVDMDIVNSDSDCELPAYEKWLPIEHIPLPNSLEMTAELYVPTPIRYNDREESGLVQPEVKFTSASGSVGNLDSDVEEEELALRTLLLAKMHSPKVNKHVKEERPKEEETRTPDPDVSLEAEALRNFLINNMKKRTQQPKHSSASVLKEAVRRLTARNTCSSPADSLSEIAEIKTKVQLAAKSVEETEIDLGQAITDMARVQIGVESDPVLNEFVTKKVMEVPTGSVKCDKIVESEVLEEVKARDNVEFNEMLANESPVPERVAVKKEIDLKHPLSTEENLKSTESVEAKVLVKLEEPEDDVDDDSNENEENITALEPASQKTILESIPSKKDAENKKETEVREIEGSETVTEDAVRATQNYNLAKTLPPIAIEENENEPTLKPVVETSMHKKKEKFMEAVGLETQQIIADVVLQTTVESITLNEEKDKPSTLNVQEANVEAISLSEEIDENSSQNKFIITTTSENDNQDLSKTTPKPDVNPLPSMPKKTNENIPQIKFEIISTSVEQKKTVETQTKVNENLSEQVIIPQTVSKVMDVRKVTAVIKMQPEVNIEKPVIAVSKKEPSLIKKSLPAAQANQKPIPKLRTQQPTTSLTKIVKPNKVINKQTIDLKRKPTDNVASSSVSMKKLKTENPTNRLITAAEMPLVKKLIIQLRASESESEYSAISGDDYDGEDGEDSRARSFLNGSITIGNEYYDIASPMSLIMESPCDTPSRTASPIVSVTPILQQPIVGKSIVNDFFEAKLDQFLKNVRSKVADSTNKTLIEHDTSPLAASVINTPVAVRHLPEASQQEYRRLINRMKMLERQKQAKNLNEIVNQTTSGTTTGESTNVPVEIDGKAVVRKVLVNNTAKKPCDKNVAQGKPLTKDVPQKLKTPQKITSAPSESVKSSPQKAMLPSKNSASPTLKPSKENLLGLYENYYHNTGNSIISNLDTSIELVSVAREAKIAKLKYEHRLQELRKEMEEVQRNLQEQQERITKIYPEICSSHRIIESLKTKRVKINSAVTALGRSVIGPSYSINNDQKSIISEKSKKLAAKIKFVNNMKLADVEKWRSQNRRNPLHDATAVVAPTEPLPPPIQNENHKSIEILNKLPVSDCETPAAATSATAVVTISVPEVTPKMETILSDTIVPEQTVSNKEEDEKNSTNGHEEALEETEPVDDKKPHDPTILGGNTHKEEKEQVGGATLQDYVSPLSHFRDERQINPNGIVCPYQLMGQCDDKDCKYMHLDE